ncbi:DUF5658 family protein [Thermococcus sp. JCM 11816]|uniref:DUF5658 family protein n=1 Tax=Thermococcus sp. (strain JCM 11816 / KS-1) TaxID=1295125 RepID=UPI000AF30666
MEKRKSLWGAAFLVFSLLDALTTWVGVQRGGFSEANPIVASRLSDPALFFGSFALFTTLGLLVIFASSYMSRFSRAFGYFPPLFILMRHCLSSTTHTFSQEGTLCSYRFQQAF